MCIIALFANNFFKLLLRNSWESLSWLSFFSVSTIHHSTKKCVILRNHLKLRLIFEYGFALELDHFELFLSSILESIVSTWKYLKENLNLSWKRIPSRRVEWNLETISLQKQLFICIKISKWFGHLSNRIYFFHGLKLSWYPRINFAYNLLSVLTLSTALF